MQQGLKLAVYFSQAQAAAVRLSPCAEMPLPRAGRTGNGPR